MRVGSIPEKQDAIHNVSKVGVPPPASAARAQLLDENATALINPINSAETWFVLLVVTENHDQNTPVKHTAAVKMSNLGLSSLL